MYFLSNNVLNELCNNSSMQLHVETEQQEKYVQHHTDAETSQLCVARDIEAIDF